MQFWGLGEAGYRLVCEEVEKHATGVFANRYEVCVKRSGLMLAFHYGMLLQVVLEPKSATFCMGTRPYCNITVAMRMSMPELVELYKSVTPE
jgi:hypothetical protein